MRIFAFTLVIAALGATGCDESCQSAQDDATAHVATASTCQAGDRCVVIDLYALAGENTCIGAFQCSTAFRAGVDLGAFARNAHDLADEVKGCHMCIEASCTPPPKYAFCNVATGRCEGTDDPVLAGAAGAGGSG